MSDTQLIDYLVGELSAEEQARVDQLVASDSHLNAELESLKSSAAQVKTALAEENYEFSPGELASLRRNIGLPALGEGDKVVSLGARLAYGGVWLGAAAACVVAMFWLVNRQSVDSGATIAGNGVEGNRAAGGGTISELWAPVSWSSNPGEGVTAPELPGVPKLMPALASVDLAKLHSPDLTKLNREMTLNLPAKVGNGSFEELRDSLLERGELPSLAAVRIDELANHFHDEFDSDMALTRYTHPWRTDGQILLAKSSYYQKPSTLFLKGKGTLRLFGEQTVVEESTEYQPASLRPLVSRDVRLWWVEGDLKGVDFKLGAPDRQEAVKSSSVSLAWQDADPKIQASMLLIGLGEFIRDSASAPTAAELLAICDSLRSETTTINKRFLTPVRMAEAAIRLKS